jgi:hypothetical protein
MLSELLFWKELSDSNFAENSPEKGSQGKGGVKAGALEKAKIICGL